MNGRSKLVLCHFSGIDFRLNCASSGCGNAEAH